MVEDGSYVQSLPTEDPAALSITLLTLSEISTPHFHTCVVHESVHAEGNPEVNVS